MKLFGLILALLLAEISYAEEVLVYETHGEFISYFKPDAAFFDHNKRKGTASVLVRAIHRDFGWDDDWPNERYQSHDIPGLYFDREVGKRGAIVYENESGSVICAYRRFWGGQKSTGLCRLEVIEHRQSQYTLQMFISSYDLAP